MRRQVTERSVTRRIAARFVAGETLDDGLAAAGGLVRRGAGVSLDYLGEDVTTASEARAAARTVLAALERLAAAGVIGGAARGAAGSATGSAGASAGGVSVKPSQMGLRVDRDLCRSLLTDIAAAAGHAGAHVTLDMEGSDVTEETVALAESLRAGGADAVGCALQAYLRRTPADIRRLTDAGASLRLCKGAYAEPREVAYQSRTTVDASFAACADWLLEHGVYPRLATHDHRLVARAQNTVARLGLDRDAFEFQMLYGVRPSLQDALLRAGWRLCVYVPFGGEWYPYFMRRLAERPANVAFFLRALRDT